MQRVPPRVLSLPRWHGASRGAEPGTTVTGAVPAAAAAGRAARAKHGGEEPKAKCWASTVAAGRASCRLLGQKESGVYLQESQILQETDLFTRKQSWAVVGRVELLLCAGTALLPGTAMAAGSVPCAGGPRHRDADPGTGISLLRPALASASTRSPLPEGAGRAAAGSPIMGTWG